ncbi:hypothetical protein HJ590_05275 [Naumannella sp. ID2617S]|uniref:Uncharacterized protein n=1 Tax=Enemella dayhoffiae TaxID=2016507 RepID=A0A255H027_9ACTN|nr:MULTISPECIES: hypothetical protein [Enemella]NNG18992.1 hypothetical protein [Naumannella sp. ID2617S]OYO19274.1 hypothetical protein CGZ93_12880 [Enemella dayhoffiae]TDO93310.1 hypothetical protein C8D81_1092 [Enemella evansiae]
MKPRPTEHHRMFLTCYVDNLHYGWRHVDLFVHDHAGREVNWVHWGVEADGPEAADLSIAKMEPELERTTEWKHGRSAAGVDYWTAEARWRDGGSDAA